MTAYNNDEGSMRDLAERFKVSFSFVASLLQKFYLHGEIAPKPHGGGYPASISVSGEAFLKELIESQPDLILLEMGAKPPLRFVMNITNTLKQLVAQRLIEL